MILLTILHFVPLLLFCPGCQTVPTRESSWHGRPAIPTNVRLVSACGVTTSVKENPWTAILFYENEFRCGATILEDDIAITAAHCVIGERNDFFRLHYGRTIQPDVGIPDPDAHKYGGVTGIEAIRIHPNYNLNQKYEGSDIAILKLKKKIHFNQLVKPIEVIPTKPKYIKMLKRGAYVKVAGFGQTRGPISGATDRDYPTHMQMIMQRIVPHQQCNRGTGNGFIGPARDVLCTRGKCGEDSNSTALFKQICPGDSGSGIVGFFQEDNKYYLLGVVSYIITPNQEDCGKSSKPAFSISTRDHRDFIYEPFEATTPDPERKCTINLAPVDGLDVAIPQIDKSCRPGEACKKKQYCPDVQQKYCDVEGLDKGDKRRKKIIKQLKGAVCNKKERAFCCKGSTCSCNGGGGGECKDFHQGHLWCYVNEGDCQDQRESLSIPGVFWSNQACQIGGNGKKDTNLGLRIEAVGDFSPWSAWTSCSSSCGGGVQGRTRKCARSNPYDCPKQFEQRTRNCNSKPCENESSSDTICETVTEKIPKPTTTTPVSTSTTEYSRIRIISDTSFTFTRKIICRDRK